MVGYMHVVVIHPGASATPYVPPTPPLTLNMAEGPSYSPSSPPLVLNMDEGL